MGLSLFIARMPVNVSFNIKITFGDGKLVKYLGIAARLLFLSIYATI